jgi:outer membrane protein insertion porin family
LARTAPLERCSPLGPFEPEPGLAIAASFVPWSQPDLDRRAGQATPQFSAEAAPQVLCQIQVIGNRRIPKESIIARLFSRAGDPYDPAVVERDFNSLWNTGYFDNVRIEKVPARAACSSKSTFAKSPPSARSTTRA